MAERTSNEAIRGTRRCRGLPKLIVLCALALFANGCVTDGNLTPGESAASLPSAWPAQADDSVDQSSADTLPKLAAMDAVEVARLPERDGVNANTIHTTVAVTDEPTAAVMARLAQTEIDDRSLDDMRGGIVFNAGIVIEFTVEFITHINGVEIVPQLVGDPALTTGVVNQVVDGQASVVATNDFTGLVSLVQNSLDMQNIQTATIVHANLFGALNAIRGSLLKSQLNFGAAAGL